jgi:excisionase family DNA binding protein
MTMQAKYLAPADVARRLGVTTATVRLMCKRGELTTAATTTGGMRLFAAEDVEALAAQRDARVIVPGKR